MATCHPIQPVVWSWKSRITRCVGQFLLGVMVLGTALTAASSASDTVEFLSGAKVEGKVIKIDAPSKLITFEASISGRVFRRVYPYSKVHAVDYQGKRYVLNAKGSTPNSTPGTSTTTRPASGSKVGEESDPAPAANGRSLRSVAEIKSLIAESGRTAPDWYENTPLDYPPSIDLSWPEKPPGGWNNQKNVGQYIWDVINPNPNRWRSGIRLMHHLLGVHKDDKDKLLKIMNELGRMYHELLQDHARAAFWFQQVGMGHGSRFDNGRNAASLAECYWRLGNRQMAVDLANKLPLTYSVIKLWGDMGDTAKCVQLATASLGSAQFPSMHYLIIGDAYRHAGQFDQALPAYQRALQAATNSQQKRDIQIRTRAQASISGLKALAGVDLARTPDGTYRASSIGYEGPVEVEVRIANKQIEEVRVVQHKEKQFYSSITDTTQKIVEQQGIKGVDATSGATITSEAIINATARAIADAIQQ